MSKTQGSIIGGVTVLGIAGILCKLLGVLFSIPLTWLIGADGLGIFQSVFPTYNLLLTLSSAGLPVAVSRMVSHYLAKDDPCNAHRVFKCALWLLTALGAAATIIMLACNGLLVTLVKEPEAAAGFRVIAPCLVIVCVMSALRGFVQGQQNMLPTAVSQLIEQIGKICISLPLAYLGYRQGGPAGGAAGALLGITLCEAVACVYMMLTVLRGRRAFAALPQITDGAEPSARTLAVRLFTIAVPITIGACIVPLAQFVDSAMMVPRMIDSGLTREVARPLYGVFSGLVIRLINIPTAMALAVSMSLVPAISAAKAVEDAQTVQRQSDLGVRLAFLIGFPCAIGMSLLARQIVHFFYYERLSEVEFATGWELLTMSSLTVVLFTVVQATSGILQGLGRQRIPMYTLVAGVAVKILLNYILIGTPGINIHGGPIASLACYGISLLPNLYFVCRYARIRFNWQEWLLRPGAATAAMGLAVWLLRELLPLARWATVLEILTGVIVYAAAAVAFKALKQEDLNVFRRRLKGRKG